MSQSSNHLRLVSWAWQWVHFTQMTSTFTRSQSNRAPLGCGGTRDSHHGCAADKSAAPVWCYHVNMDQNLIKTLLNLSHEEIRQFWRQKGVQSDTSKVYLIKWAVNVSHKSHNMTICIIIGFLSQNITIYLTNVTISQTCKFIPHNISIYLANVTNLTMTINLIIDFISHNIAMWLYLTIWKYISQL